MKSWTVNSYSQSRNNASLLTFDANGNAWFLSNEQQKIFSEGFEINLPDFVQDVISFDFLEFEKCWTVLTKNEIFTFQDDVWTKIGDIDHGIMVSKWSPDQSVLVIVSGEAKLILLSSDFQIINESFLDNDAVPLSSLVSIGWGKKATQFHGSEGKAAALTKFVGKLSENDDGSIRVSWRGDAEYFVVSFIKENRRSLKVFNRNGGLHAESEEIPCLEHSLSWRPSGNWIASSQKLPNRQDIVLIEKNGLKHRDFSLRISPESIVNEISWNSDSTGLAVQIYNPSSKTYELQFWTSSNYHWYLKHVINFDGSEQLRKFYWDPFQSHLVHYITTSGIYHQLKFVRDVYVSSSTSSENPGTVIVVDGVFLKMTPFKFQNVPPPMSSLALELPNPVTHVSFSGHGNGDNICVHLNDDSVYFFKSQISSQKVELPTLMGSFKLQSLDTFHYRQLQWVKENLLVAIVYNKVEDKDSVAIIHIDGEKSELHVKTVEIVHFSGFRLVRLHYNNKGYILAEDNHGGIFELEICGEATFLKSREGFPEVCPWFSYIPISQDESTNDLRIIGMTDTNNLYLNQTLLTNECTSFFVHNRQLLFTTFSHKLFLLPFNSNFQNFSLEKMDLSAYNQQLRSVEIGSQIVIAVPDDTRVVFQMPRGNLETVHPRGLLLDNIKSLLKDKKYLPAFLICRKNRLDLNLLIDYDPQAFARDVEMAMSEIGDPEYINLLIASLKDEDVTQTIYKGSFNETDHKAITCGKTNSICNLIVSTLEKIDEEKYLNSILTGLAKKSPPDLERATNKILQIKESKGADAADDAIKYLIFLADPTKLFDYALGVYDFELVILVAQNSQKDPREYLQFLNNLQLLEQNLQRFTIDDHLGRYERALRNLVLSGDLEKSFKYIKEHGLYKAALDIFKGDDINYSKALLLYADFLEDNEEYEEAGAMYLLAKNEGKSLENFKKAMAWQEIFMVAHMSNYSGEALFELGSEIMDGLIASNNYRAAAQVAMDYQDNMVLAVEILSLGGFWNEAVRLGMKHSISDVLERIVEPHMIKSLKYLHDDIIEIFTNFKKDKEKLMQVRRRNERKIQLANDPNLENIDLQSDTSSMATTFISGTSFSNMTSRTARTARTAKQKRKMERKKAAGKVEAFQEDFLIGSLRKSIERVDNLQDDVGSRLRFMILHGYFSEAKRLQKEFSDLIEFMKASIPDIFEKDKTLTIEEMKQKWINNPMLLAESQQSVSPPIISNSKWKVDFISR